MKQKASHVFIIQLQLFLRVLTTTKLYYLYVWNVTYDTDEWNSPAIILCQHWYIGRVSQYTPLFTALP